MTEREALHVLFTMDCQPAATTSAPEGPRSWEQSARSIDGYCTCLMNAGYPATLFLTPRCAEEHAPLVEELAERGVELGLYVQPQTLDGAGYHRHLGQYDRPEQSAIVQRAKERFQDSVGARPLSVRSALFSASDDTFAVLSEHGFQQGSVSSPGRQVTKHAAAWVGAATDPHYVDSRSRLRAGDLPFLEVPVTTDAGQLHGGLAPDLAIENGTFAKWHLPLIDGQLQRLERQQVRFKTLCFFTRNCFAYNSRGDKLAETLDAILAYLASLEDRYEAIPVTLSGAHSRFRECVRSGIG